jgi:voltage-gated potassium channel
VTVTIKDIVERNDHPAGRVFDLCIQGLIFLSLFAFCVETLPDLPANTRRWLEIFEIVCVAIFSLEYLVRLWVAERKLAYIFSFYGVIDLVAILPFYLARSVDLRSLRILRLFRLLRLLRFFSPAIDRFRRAFIRVRAELACFFAATGLMLFVSSVGIYYFERGAQPEAFRSIFHAMWWSVITLTTVGYGDAYPVTVGGRIFTFFILMLGLGIISVPSGLLASALNNTPAIVDAGTTNGEER